MRIRDATTLADLGDKFCHPEVHTTLDISAAMPVMTCVMIVLQRLHGLMAVHASCSSRRAWRRT